MGHSSLVKIYNMLPIFAQNLIIDYQGKKICKKRYNKTFSDYLTWLHETQWWPLDELKEYQNSQLRKLIKHAYETVPYYNRIMKLRGLLPKDIDSVDDLAKLPLLNKKILLEEGENMFSKNYQAPVFTTQTSGTTGSGMVIKMSQPCRDMQWAVWWRHRNRFGFNHGDDFFMISGQSVVPFNQSRPPFWRKSKTLNQTYASIYHMKDEYLKYYVELIEKVGFSFFSGYPSSFYILADYLRQQNHKLAKPPRIIQTGAESVLDINRELCREWLDAEIADQYGQAEACANCAQCPEEGNYHMDMELGVFEQLPINKVGFENAGWIVGTSLHNFYMPFIRFNTGDIGEFSEQQCACGRKSPILKKIDGRIESFVVTPDGRRIGRMDHCFKAMPEVRMTQIVQEARDLLRLKIMPGQNYDKKTEEILRRNVSARVGDDMRIEFELVDNIEMGKSGKMRAVISKLDETFTEPQNFN